MSSHVTFSLTSHSHSSDISDLLIREDWQSLMEKLERFRPQLRRIASDLNLPALRLRSDASDIVQETFHDAVRGLSQVQAKNSKQFFGWLLALLQRRVLHARRKHMDAAKRDVRRERRASRDSLATYLIQADKGVLPEDVVMELELVERVRRAVSKLPDELKMLLRWRYEEGLEYQQIGDRVGRAPDAVRMLINRCLKRLRKEME